MGSCFCRDSVLICLMLPENMIICDKCLSKCGKQAKLNDLRFITFCVLLHFALYRVNAKCNKINAKCSKFINMVYVGGMV